MLIHSLLEIVGQALGYAVPFVCVLAVLVFVHEFGHFWVARRCGVKVEAFSIGFGPEILGFNDRHGTRWKVCALPLGGFVKMFGDADPSSRPSDEVLEMNAADRSVAFFHKPVAQRAAIVLAGPAFNFIFSILVLTGLFLFVPNPMPPSVVGKVSPGSAAEQAGIQVGDRIVSIDSHSVSRFIELSTYVQASDGQPMAIRLKRGNEDITVSATARPRDDVMLDMNNQPVLDANGEPKRMSGLLLGVGQGDARYTPVQALQMGVSETWDLSTWMVKVVGEIITGQRKATELGGPIGIAQLSGDVARSSLVLLVWVMALLSINLGVVNLLPVPVLDGGHLAFYAAEAIRGRPLGPKVQEYSFRLGLALVLSLLLFVTWNDLDRLQVMGLLTKG